ncbi:hypothetical protein APV67_10880 [Staphylococcus aureus]|nr:hypothetical protein APV67_10880 [Staphylococcus aureus]
MYKTKGGFQLTLQTLSLVVGFMAWSIIAPLMPFIKQDVNVTEGQISIILAIPVILGSVLRVPFGYLTNIVGAKWVFFTSFIVLLFPIFFLSQAQTPGMLMASGFFLGVGGAIFSVGVTSVPKYFPKEKVGLANGIYGMGNIGTAVSSFVTNIYETDELYYLEAELAGANKEDISIDFNNNVLTIQATRSAKYKSGKLILDERNFESLIRQFDFEAVDKQNITASFENGLLTITLPKIKPSNDTTSSTSIPIS